MKEGIDVSFINQHETRVDDVVIKVGLTHREWYKGLDNLVNSRQTIFKLIGTSDNMTQKY